MAKTAQFGAHSDRVFSQTPHSISFKLLAFEHVPGGYLGYRGFWPESLGKPEIVKTMFYVKCEYLGHLSSHGTQFIFILCAYGVLVLGPNPRFKIRKKPEVEFFENCRPHFNGWFPRRFARKRYCRFSLNLAVRR